MIAFTPRWVLTGERKMRTWGQEKRTMDVMQIVLLGAVFAAGYGLRRPRRVDQLGEAWVIIKPVAGKVRLQIDTNDGRGLYVDLVPDRAGSMREELRAAMGSIMDTTPSPPSREE